VRWQTVWLYDLKAGTTREVCKNSNAHAATWNPSGTRLAFQGDDTTHTYAKFWIWLVNPDGSNLRRISEGPEDEHPLWSPDGKRLVWSRARRLWQADSAGSNGHFLTKQPPPYVREYARAWTEDQTHLLFVRGSEMGEEFRLWQVGRDSTEDTPDSTRTPAFSRSEIGVTSDGRLIYARGQPHATDEIRFWERGTRGGSRRCFVPDSVGVWLVALAPDRSFVVFSSGDEEQMDLWLARWRTPASN
jgi:dipeptidyl aminopeptidase/acylaminoacyl peptidase